MLLAAAVNLARLAVLGVTTPPLNTPVCGFSSTLTMALAASTGMDKREHRRRVPDERNLAPTNAVEEGTVAIERSAGAVQMAVPRTVAPLAAARSSSCATAATAAAKRLAAPSVRRRLVWATFRSMCLGLMGAGSAVSRFTMASGRRR
jgi:hypothetical protein